MVSTCCVPNCRTFKVKGRNNKFHRFPKKAKIRKTWVEAIYKKKDITISDSSFVCRKHFTKFDYKKNSQGRIVLSENAVPSIFSEAKNLPKYKKKQKINNSTHECKTSVTINENIEDESQKNTNEILSQPPCVLPNVLDSVPFTKNIGKDNFHEICRCCVVNRGELNVFEAHFCNISFADLIYFCTREKIVPLDGMPKSVCNFCTQQIINSFAFAKKVQEMQVHIRDLHEIFTEKPSEHCNDTDFCNNTSINSNTSLRNSSNYYSESIPSSVRTFKQRYKGLTHIYKQLCDFLSKTKKQLKKCSTTKQSIPTQEKKEISEDQGIKSKHPAACVEEIYIDGKSNEKLDTDNLLIPVDILSMECDSAANLSKSENCEFQQVAEENISVSYECKGDDETDLMNVEEITCLFESEERKIRKFSPLRNNEYILTESYREAVDDGVVSCEVYSVPDGELKENLEKLTQSTYGEIKFNKNDIFFINRDVKEEKRKKMSIQCFECLEMFQSEMKLIQHCRLTGHVMTDRIKCKFCSSTFRLLKAYREHLQSHNKTKCICEICGIEMFSKSLKKHMEVHNNMRNHVCQFCGKTYTQKCALDDHIKYQHGDVGNKFLCSICGKFLKNSSELNKHLNEDHVDDDLTNKCHQCNICQKYFSSLVSLTFHQKFSHAEDRISRKRQDKRKQLFPAKREYIKKKQTSRLKKYIPKQCSTCLKFLHPSAYKLHMRIHQGIKPYKCKICDKFFRQECHLQSHMNIHLNLKPYKCTYCQKCFRHNLSLSTHVRSHTGERPYRCPVCDRGFVHLTAMKNHRQIHLKKTEDNTYPQQPASAVISKKQSTDETEADGETSTSVSTDGLS